MSQTQFHDAAAIFAIIAAVGVVLIVLVRLVPTVFTIGLSGLLHRYQLWLAALVAGSATLGSLWFSEHFDWVPCRYCWYQRIFMYSAAVVLVVAALRKDHGAKWYAAPLAGIGLLVSTWHILLEHGVVQESKQCALTTPCATPYLISFGDRDPVTLGPTGFPAITLAVMAFCAFAAILALLLLPEALDTELDDLAELGTESNSGGNS